MNERQTLSYLANQMRMGSSRATVREFDDSHLMQQVKKADVYHSETPSDFERWQMVGVSSHPLKQDQDDQQQQSNQKAASGGSGGDEADWNHDQPKGKAAEALMLYVGGSRSHPVALVDDRRVRPYNTPEGSSSFYAASGTGQMLYHNDDGTYLVSVNNPKYGKNQEEKERVVSMRHVDKQPQSRDLSAGEQQQEEYKHEGETVNTEVRTSKKKIEILDGETVIAVYDKDDKSWTFSNFKKLTIQPEDEFNVTTKKITMTATDDKFDINGKPVNVNGGGPTIPPFTVPG